MYDRKLTINVNKYKCIVHIHVYKQIKKNNANTARFKWDVTLNKSRIINSKISSIDKGLSWACLRFRSGKRVW